MRIFPPITEPENIEILLDIHGRRKHLEGVAKHVLTIAKLNHELMEQERLGPNRDNNFIEDRKREI
jgi:hypothetical protein